MTNKREKCEHEFNDIGYCQRCHIHEDELTPQTPTEREGEYQSHSVEGEAGTTIRDLKKALSQANERYHNLMDSLNKIVAENLKLTNDLAQAREEIDKSRQEFDRVISQFEDKISSLKEEIERLNQEINWDRNVVVLDLKEQLAEAEKKFKTAQNLVDNSVLPAGFIAEFYRIVNNQELKKKHLQVK